MNSYPIAYHQNSKQTYSSMSTMDLPAMDRGPMPPLVPPKTPSRPQGPRAPGSNRPILGELSPSLRNRIVQAREDGKSWNELHKRFGLARLALWSTIKQDNARTSGISRQGRGKKVKLTDEQRHHLLEVVWEDPDIQIKILQHDHAPHITIRTIQRALKQYNIKKWKKHKRPQLLP